MGLEEEENYNLDLAKRAVNVRVVLISSGRNNKLL